MACQVEQIGDCGDISTLARALFILDKDDDEWLTQCCLSLSSCGSLLAVGFKNRLCLLTAQWISSLEANNYLISWNGTLSTDITAVLALPLCPTQSSSQSGPDWFCIIVGFKNGAVGFYTHTGHLLFMEKYDDKPVLKLSCHTGTYGTLPDDINVLYQNCQCMISGASLFPTLRYAKAQLARVQAGVLSDYTVDSNSVSVKKWSFSDQESINDACVVGLELKNTYDHLLAASTYGGYDAWYRSIPPANTLILGAGAKPFVGFHYALEGGSAPPLQDVARAVANKIKSALPGWLGGGGSGGSEAPNRPEPRLRAEPLSMRAGLQDSRQGTLLALSPDRRLAAVSDSVGRVVVVDVSRGHAVRLIKGCRDAQCAFVQVFEQDSKKPQLSTIKGIRRALFLIIYNPKKGLVDIRLMMRGTRVAVFTATKNGVLVYNTCGLVGAEQNYMNKRLNLPEQQCVLIDPDGKLKKFNIPFYFALEGENSQRSKDLHILRELRDYLKRTSKSDYDKDEILKKAADLKTLDLKKHCLEMLIRNYCVPPLTVMECLKIFWYNTTENQSNDNVINIKQYYSNLALVTLFYLKINNISTEIMKDLINCVHKHLNQPDFDEKVQSDENKELNFKLLVDDDCILERLLILAQEKDYKDHQHARVTFADNLQNSYKDFLAVFDLENESTHINLKSDVSTEKTSTLASYVFKLLFKIKDLPALTEFVMESNIDVKDIVKLLIVHIMNMNLEDINLELIEKLIKVLYYLCRSSHLTSEISYNEISDWWQSIRDILLDMPCPLRSMIVAMACKAVSQNFETKTSDEEAWESVTKENAKWGILIGKLEDISILSIIMHLKETYKGISLPKLYGYDFDVNLKLIYSKGKGSVTELIAKWLCSMGVPPEAIIANELMDKVTEATDNQDDDTDALFLEDHKDLVDENPRIFKWLSLLRQQFPLSTGSDYILVNMCWEYANSWQKGVKELEKLKAVVVCLKNIADHNLRLGACTLVWTAYIKQTFESACRLVNKVGKLPKEILCLQDVGFSDVQMVKFLEISTTYLGLYFEYSNKNWDKPTMKVQFEKIWEESVPSLIEVALETKKVNIDILNLTYQISLTIYYQCHFNIKVNKPLNNLFDVEYHFIFENLTESGKPLNLRPSEKLKAPRQKFISKLIRGAIESITCTNEDAVAIDNYNTIEYAEWMEKVETLAELWCVERDFIRRQQLIGLYQCGFDSIAEDCLPQVVDIIGTLSTIVAVTAQRLKRHLECCEDPSEWLASVHPQLSRVVEMQELDPSVSSNVPLESTASFIRKMLSRCDQIPEQSHKDCQMLKIVLRGCETITELKL